MAAIALTKVVTTRKSTGKSFGGRRKQFGGRRRGRCGERFQNVTYALGDAGDGVFSLFSRKLKGVFLGDTMVGAVPCVPTVP